VRVPKIPAFLHRTDLRGDVTRVGLVFVYETAIVVALAVVALAIAAIVLAVA